MTTEAAKYVFLAADAFRAMGLPDHPRMAHLSLCILIDPNGFVTVGEAIPIDGAHFDAAIGESEAFRHASEKMFAARGYAERETASHSEALQTAIRLEKAGLPAGRYDVNPLQVPAIIQDPEGFTMARSATFPVTDGLVDPEVVAKAWEEVRAQIAAADPPFPITMLGYTVSGPTETERDGVKTDPIATLTVFA